MAHPRRTDWYRVAVALGIVAFSVAFWVGVGVLLVVMA